MCKIDRRIVIFLLVLDFLNGHITMADDDTSGMFFNSQKYGNNKKDDSFKDTGDVNPWLMEVESDAAPKSQAQQQPISNYNFNNPSQGQQMGMGSQNFGVRQDSKSHHNSHQSNFNQGSSFNAQGASAGEQKIKDFYLEGVNVVNPPRNDQVKPESAYGRHSGHDQPSRGQPSWQNNGQKQELRELHNKQESRQHPHKWEPPSEPKEFKTKWQIEEEEEAELRKKQLEKSKNMDEYSGRRNEPPLNKNSRFNNNYQSEKERRQDLEKFGIPDTYYDKNGRYKFLEPEPDPVNLKRHMGHAQALTNLNHREEDPPSTIQKIKNWFIDSGVNTTKSNMKLCYGIAMILTVAFFTK